MSMRKIGLIVYICILCVSIMMMSPLVYASNTSSIAIHMEAYDNDGNLLPDGDVALTLRLLSNSQGLIYEEVQDVSIVHGFIATAMGRGNVSDDQVFMNFGHSIFQLPDDYYVELYIQEYDITRQMDIMSVPLASHAYYAENVANQSIDSVHIVDHALKKNHFSPDTIDDLFIHYLDGREFVYADQIQGLYARPETAGQIGVKNNFHYSGANRVAHVLMDLDAAIKTRDDRISKIDDDRLSADQTIDAQIGHIESNITTVEQGLSLHADQLLQETNLRSQEDQRLLGQLSQETALRSQEDLQLNHRLSAMVDQNGVDHNNLRQDMQLQGQGLSGDIDMLNQQLISGLSSQQENINQLSVSTDNHVSTLNQTVEHTRNALQGNIDNLSSTISQEISQVNDDLDTKVGYDALGNVTTSRNLNVDGFLYVDKNLTADATVQARLLRADRVDTESINLHGNGVLPQENPPAGGGIYPNSIIFAWGHVNRSGHLISGFNVKSVNYELDLSIHRFIYKVEFLRAATSADSYAAIVTYNMPSDDFATHYRAYGSNVYYRSRSMIKILNQEATSTGTIGAFDFIIVGY